MEDPLHTINNDEIVERCPYIIKRGSNQGNACGNTTIDYERSEALRLRYNYCRSCITKTGFSDMERAKREDKEVDEYKARTEKVGRLTKSALKKR